MNPMGDSKISEAEASFSRIKSNPSSSQWDEFCSTATRLTQEDQNQLNTWLTQQIVPENQSPARSTFQFNGSPHLTLATPAWVPNRSVLAWDYIDHLCPDTEVASIVTTIRQLLLGSVVFHADGTPFPNSEYLKTKSSLSQYPQPISMATTIFLNRAKVETEKMVHDEKVKWIDAELRIFIPLLVECMTLAAQKNLTSDDIPTALKSYVEALKTVSHKFGWNWEKTAQFIPPLFRDKNRIWMNSPHRSISITDAQEIFDSLFPSHFNFEIGNVSTLHRFIETNPDLKRLYERHNSLSDPAIKSMQGTGLAREITFSGLDMLIRYEWESGGLVDYAAKITEIALTLELLKVFLSKYDLGQAFSSDWSRMSRVRIRSRAGYKDEDNAGRYLGYTSDIDLMPLNTYPGRINVGEFNIGEVFVHEIGHHLFGYYPCQLLYEWSASKVKGVSWDSDKDELDNEAIIAIDTYLPRKEKYSLRNANEFTAVMFEEFVENFLCEISGIKRTLPPAALARIQIMKSCFSTSGFHPDLLTSEESIEREMTAHKLSL